MIQMVTEQDKKVFQEEFAGLLPSKIFDSHVHIILKESYSPEWGTDKISYLEKTQWQFTVEQFFSIYKEMLPGIEMSLAGFGGPSMKVDRSHASSFGVNNKNVFGLRLLSAYDSVEEAASDIEKYHLAGVKPYANMALKRENGEGELLDFFTKEQLEYLNKNQLIATIHIPRKMRLEDPCNRTQMKYLCETYPDIKFIFAHIGRAYYKRCAVNYVDEFVQYPNAYWDTAMINHEGVLQYTFDHFPNDRILFGTDAPISFLHGKSVEINNQYVYMSPENFNLGTSLYDDTGKITYVPFLYEQIRSILSLGLSRKTLEDFFYNNAYTLYSRTVERMK